MKIMVHVESESVTDVRCEVFDDSSRPESSNLYTGCRKPIGTTVR